MRKDKLTALIWLAMQLETDLETVEQKMDRLHTVELSVKHALLCEELNKVNKEIQTIKEARVA